MPVFRKLAVFVLTVATASSNLETDLMGASVNDVRHIRGGGSPFCDVRYKSVVEKPF